MPLHKGGLAVAGFSEQGDAQSLREGIATSGMIPNGAIVERELADDFINLRSFVLQLTNPDFNTAVRIADAIQCLLPRALWSKAGQGARLSALSSCASLARVSATRFIAQIEGLAIQPDTPAKVVVDERTGTVVIGNHVQISTVAVTYGSMVVRITERPIASQPEPFSENGQTVVLPDTSIDVNQDGGSLSIIGGDRLADHCQWA